MKTPHYSIETLREYLEQRLVATLEQVRRKLGRPARATLFRMLAKAGALSSYSHRGKYYTLPWIPRFSREGLWEYEGVRFSRFGNLLGTIKAFVEDSRCGYTARELEDQLGVETKHALVQLVRREQVRRIRLSGMYVYLSSDGVQSREQEEARRQQEAELPTALLGPKARMAVEEAKAALVLFWSTLDERQRRLYAGLEAARLGYGGDQYVAALFGIDRHTVARGRDELMRGEHCTDRIRQAGAGRPSVKKNA